MDAELLIALERYDEAEELLGRQLRDAQTAGDRTAASVALEALGQIAIRRGREQHALDLLRESLEFADDPDPAERTGLYFELARLLASTGRRRRRRRISWRRCSSGCAPATPTTWRRSPATASPEHGSGRLRPLHRGGPAARRGAARRRRRARPPGRRARQLRPLAAQQHHRPLRAGRRLRAACASAQRGDRRRMGTGAVSPRPGAHPAHHRRHRAGRRAPGRVPRPARRSAGNGARGLPERSTRPGWRSSAATPNSRSRSPANRSRCSSNAAIPGELGIAQLTLARGLDELGDDAGAEQAYTAAIDLFRRRPGWHRERSRAHRWYGKFLRRHGRDEAALREFELAADLAPRNR